MMLLGETHALGQALRTRARDRHAAWTEARVRGLRAGMPEARGYATPPSLLPPKRAWSVTARVPANWCTWDGGDGNGRRLPRGLASRPQAEVLSVSGQACGGMERRHVRCKPVSPPGRRPVGHGAGPGLGRRGTAGTTGAGPSWQRPWSRVGGAAG